MKAAVVSSFDRPPRFLDFPDPAPSGDHEMVVEMLAAGLHPRVRSQADGSHYTSTDDLPMVPGIDGVGRDPEGTLRYFVLPDTTLGTMAQRTVIDSRRSIELPADIDPIAVAAAMNPLMSSWVGLRRRTAFAPGQKVLVLGATGNAGRLAVQVAAHFGAGETVAAARDADRLAQLRDAGATDLVTLDRSTTPDELAAAGRDVDVVIDYLWGEPTAEAMRAIVPAREDDSRLLTWLQIGSVAGSTAPIPSAALRATRLQIVGSGQGSVNARDILSELPEIAAEVVAGTFELEARPVPLAEVEQAWTAASTGTDRIVITP